jgi:hypothetical protein
MNQTINERYIKFSSRIPYSKDITLGDDVTLVIDGKSFIANNVKTEAKNNQDETVDLIYNLKFLSE